MRGYEGESGVERGLSRGGHLTGAPGERNLKTHRESLRRLSPYAEQEK